MTLTGRQIDAMISGMTTQEIEQMLGNKSTFTQPEDVVSLEARTLDWIIFWVAVIWAAAVCGATQ